MIPMMPPSPMQPMNQPSMPSPGNMMSGLPPDIIQKVLKTVTKTVGDTVSGMAQQALGQGVPWGHVLQELMKMAPPEAMSMMGGGSPPPGGGIPGGDGNKPPQQPGGMTKNQDSMQAPPSGDLNSLLIPQQQMQSQQQQPSMQLGQAQQSFQIPQILPANGAWQGASTTPTGDIHAQGQASAILSRLLPGLIPAASTNEALAQQNSLYDIAKKKQTVTGTEPIQPYQQLQQDTELAKNRATLEKDALTRRDAYFKSINEPLSSAKDLSLTESALTGIDDITNLLGIKSDAQGNVTIANEKLLRSNNWLSKNRQQLERARNLYINKTLRRDSGAAIGKKEENDFKNIVGFDIGMKAFMQNPKVIAKAVLESKDQLTRDRNRLSPNEKQRGLVTGLRDRGFKDAEIYEYLQRTGEV